MRWIGWKDGWERGREGEREPGEGWRERGMGDGEGEIESGREGERNGKIMIEEWTIGHLYIIMYLLPIITTHTHTHMHTLPLPPSISSFSSLLQNRVSSHLLCK